MGDGGLLRSIENRQYPRRAFWRASLDRIEDLVAVVTAGSDLIRYQQDRYGDKKDREPHGRPSAVCIHKSILPQNAGLVHWL